MVVALLPRVLAAGDRHTECLVLACRHAGLLGATVLHTPVLANVIENILETLERLPRAGTVGGTEEPGVAGTTKARLLHGSLVQAVEHLIPRDGHVTVVKDDGAFLVSPVVVSVGEMSQTDVVIINIVTLPVLGTEPSHGLPGYIDQRGGDRQLGERT